MPTADEEHRDRQPRRPGRFDHHLQARPRRRALQRGRLDLGQALHRRQRLALRERGALTIEHPHRVRGRDPQIDADQASVDSSSSPRLSVAHRLAREATLTFGHGPKDTAQPRLPLMCCKRIRPQRVDPLPSCGASVAGSGVTIRLTRPDPHRPPSVRVLNATTRTSRDDNATPEPRTRGGSPEPVLLTCAGSRSARSTRE